MMQHRHRRRRRYGEEKRSKAPLIRLGAMAALVLAVLFVGKKTLEFFGVGNARRLTAAVLEIEPGGMVSVSVEGGTLKRAETDVKLYAGDSVVTSPRNFARLQMFDGSSVRLNESTQVNIIASFEGEEQSTMSLELTEGELWLASPTLDTYSGAITRTITTPYLSTEVPSQAEVVISPRSVVVFAADGLGLPITVAGNDQNVIVGEGQQFTLPPGGEQVADLYEYRNPLSTQQILSEFVEESRNMYANTARPNDIVVTGSEDTQPVNDGIILEVQNPEDGGTIETATVEVSGRIGEDVERVRINGYMADVNLNAGTFSEELALPDEDEVSIDRKSVV